MTPELIKKLDFSKASKIVEKASLASKLVKNLGFLEVSKLIERVSLASNFMKKTLVFHMHES